MMTGVDGTITISFGGCKYCGESDGGVTGFCENPWMHGVMSRFWKRG